jgi:predicted enzyme related to lactoylglutathione lyase
MTSAPPRRAGTVVWVDLSTSDVERAIHFYERLFGWHYDEHETETGLYVVARVAAGEVGGMMSQAPEEIATGAPPSWTVVVGSDQLEAALDETLELGGSVLQRPLSIPGGARIAVIADPSGAVLALMQAPPSEHGMVWGETGAVSWVECLSRDPAASRRFCEALFGWKSEEGTGGYVVFSRDGERVGGLMTMPAAVPVDVPSYWLAYFAVDDVASTCARVPELGGTVIEPTHDIEEGRFAVLGDPAGAVFAVFESRTAP